MEFGNHSDGVSGADGAEFQLGSRTKITRVLGHSVEFRDWGCALTTVRSHGRLKAERDWPSIVRAEREKEELITGWVPPWEGAWCRGEPPPLFLPHLNHPFLTEDTYTHTSPSMGQVGCVSLALWPDGDQS